MRQSGSIACEPRGTLFGFSPCWAVVQRRLQTHRTAATNPAERPVTYLPLPGRPFQPVPTLDGCWIFVSIVGEGLRSEGGIAVVHRHKGKAEVKLFTTKEHLSGMTLTHDGRLLIAGTGNGVLFVDSDRLIAGEKNPIAGRMATSSETPSASYLSTTADDRFLFVSNESADTISGD